METEKKGNDVENALRRQVAHGPREAPVDPTEVVDAGRESRRIRLLMALTDDEAVHAEWARSVEYDEQDHFGRAAWLRAEADRVDRRVDTALEGDERDETIELLARCGVPWRHEALVDALREDDDLDCAAAMVLARSTPGRLRPVLLECELVDDVVATLRAGAVVGADALWDQFLIWHGRIEDLEEVDDELRAAQLSELEGVGAALDPTLYGRGVLGGDYGAEWLRDPRAVADVLQTYGPSDWLEVAATIELAADEGFELAATLAVSAALGVGVEPPDEDEAELLLELLAEEPRPDQKESPWESLAAKLGYGFQVALGGEEYGLLLAQAAAHERLVTWGIHSPGIRGLPLSTTAEDHLEAETVEEVVETVAGGVGESPQMLVAAVRTLYDALVWARRGGDGVDAIVEGVARAFEGVGDEAVELARSHLLAEVDPAHRRRVHEEFGAEPTLSEAMVLGTCEPEGDSAEVFELLADRVTGSETTVGLDCARRISASRSEDALELLGELWLRDAPVLRAPFLRDALVEAVAVDVDSRADES